MKTKEEAQDKPKKSRLGTVRASVRNFISNDGYLFSAGLAYYGLFSIVPLALLTVSVAGFFLGSQTAEAEVVEALERYVGEDAADLLSKVFHDMANRGGSTVGTLAGALLLLYGAARLFLKLQTSFNTMWGVRLRSELSALELLRHRLLSLSMILLPALVLFVGLLLSTGISWLSGHGWLLWLQVLTETFGPFVVTWAALATVMLTLPDVRLRIRDVWATSLLAAVVCYGTTRVVGAWLAWSSDSTRIVLTSVSVLMTIIVWVNIIAIVLIYCVSLTRVLYEAKGNTIQPYEYAARFRVTFEEPPQIEQSDD